MLALLLLFLLPSVLLLMAISGYFVFYLESQKYQARDSVINGVRWHSLACVIAAVCIGWGQSGLASRAPLSEMTALKAQNEALAAKLRASQESNGQLKRDLQIAHAESVKATIQLAEAESKQASDAELIVDLTMSHHSSRAQRESPTEQAESSPKIQEEPKGEPLIQAASEAPPSIELLKNACTKFGESVNPLYQTDRAEKRFANALILETLAALDVYEGSLAGHGPATSQAVRDYQQSRGLPVTGIFAKRTLAAVERDFAKRYRLATNF